MKAGRGGPVAGTLSAQPKRAVLVVDDDETTRRLLACMLTMSGFSCRLASDGDEGVRSALALQPDLIIMDVVMPQLGGVDAVARLRSDPRTHDTPVLFLTGLSEPGFLAEHLSTAADDYLVKPMGHADLIKRVRLALRRSESLHELDALTAGPKSPPACRAVG